MGRRTKVTSYAVRATPNQRARWWYWAQRAGYQVLGKWLERLATAEVHRLEVEHGYRREPDS